jgi:ferredoxin
LLNHAARRSSCNRMAGCGGCSAACSSTALKCATNGFTDPDAIFSVRPLPDTTSSHLRREQNRPHLAHRNRTNPSKRRNFSFPASCVLTSDAGAKAGRARSRAARPPPWYCSPLPPPRPSSDLADPGHELLPPMQSAQQTPEQPRGARQCSSCDDKIAACDGGGVRPTVLQRTGSCRRAAEADEPARVLATGGERSGAEWKKRGLQRAACLVVVD